MAKDENAEIYDSLRKHIADCVYQACVQVCGGGIRANGGRSTSISTADILSLFQALSRSSVSFPNCKTNKQKKSQRESSNDAPTESSNIDGKPHDIEVRIPLTLYHRWKNRLNINHKIQKKKQKKRRREHAASPIEENEPCCTNDSNKIDSARGNEEGRTCCQACDGGGDTSSCVGSTPSTATNEAKHSTMSSSSGKNADLLSTKIQVVSNLGLVRTISSPYELAALLIQPLEDLLCQNQDSSTTSIQKQHSSSLFHVQTTSSGILCITSEERAKKLQNAGRFPCPYCIAWCKGMKGLWWHQQLNHNIQHSLATSTALSNTHAATSSLAIVVYNRDQNGKAKDIIGNLANQGERERQHRSSNQRLSSNTDLTKPTNIVERMFELVKQGDLTQLQNIIDREEKVKGLESTQAMVSSARDSNGSTLLLWAAGGGCVDLCRYLIETYNCDPWQSQLGKRGFRGRTALHWAARNGHQKVVQYLIEYQEDQDRKRLESENRAIQATGTTESESHTSESGIHSSTTTTTAAAVTRNKETIDTRNLRDFLEQATSDGTTAFGWASWQGHLDIMRLLHDKGCNIHAVNNFGCNSALWCAQGQGCTVPTMEWLKSNRISLDLVNHNGHGAIHKAAQRGQFSVCQWLWQNVLLPKTTAPTATENLDGAALGSPTDTTTLKQILQRPIMTNTALDMIAPDQEGFCPSDLAGMEGHEELGHWLADQEILLIRTLQIQQDKDGLFNLLQVAWLQATLPGVNHHISLNEEHRMWERHGGVRRMRSVLLLTQS